MDVAGYIDIVPYSPWVILIHALPLVSTGLINDLIQGKKRRALCWGLGILIIVFAPFLMLGLLDLLTFKVIGTGTTKIVRTFFWAHMLITGFLYQTMFWGFLSGWLFATGRNNRLGKIALVICILCFIVLVIMEVYSEFPRDVVIREMWESRMISQ